MNHRFVRAATVLAVATALMATCSGAPHATLMGFEPLSETCLAIDPAKPFALVGAFVVDGTGEAPLSAGTVFVDRGKVIAVGAVVELPPDCQIVDVTGATVLPGLVNAHVHNAYCERHAALYAYSGVTTVRDLSCGAWEVRDATAFRDAAASDPRLCRIVSAGALITVPWGYKSGYGIRVRTQEQARSRVDEELDAGVDFIKIVFHEPPAGGGINLSPELGASIVARAHERGVPVTSHVRTSRDLAKALDCGVDDIAHIVEDLLPDQLIQRMIGAGVPMEATLTDWATSSGSERQIILTNFKRFCDAGGVVALGAEHIHTAKNAGAFVGMPVAELWMMQEAGMAPMQIIVASTRTAAEVCGLGDVLGTLEPGKAADILVLGGNPLADLSAFEKVRMVIHSGVIIRG